jgi:hypothetical protein
MALLKDKPRFANVLKMAADKAGWGKPLPAGRARGIALMEGYDTYMAQVAEVSLKDGSVKVHRVTVVADLGQHGQPRHGGSADPVQRHLRHGAGADAGDHAGQGRGAADQLPQLPGGAHARGAGDRHRAGQEHREARRHRRAGHGALVVPAIAKRVRGGAHRQAGAQAA